MRFSNGACPCAGACGYGPGARQRRGSLAGEPTGIAVLIGDPSKPDPFVLRVKFQANAIVPPHRHATAENLTVLSGEIFHSMGETLDQAHGDRLDPGGFVFLPPMILHAVWAGSVGSVVQVTGTGPFGLIYVRRSDDPNSAP